MEWLVKTREGTIPFSPNMLVETLMDKFMKAGPQPDREHLVMTFADFLQEKRALHEVQLLQLMLMCFSLGYYYKVFMTNNEVEVKAEEVKNEQSSTVNESPSSTGSSAEPDDRSDYTDSAAWYAESD